MAAGTHSNASPFVLLLPPSPWPAPPPSNSDTQRRLGAPRAPAGRVFPAFVPPSLVVTSMTSGGCPSLSRCYWLWRQGKQAARHACALCRRPGFPLASAMVNVAGGAGQGWHQYPCSCPALGRGGHKHLVSHSLLLTGFQNIPLQAQGSRRGSMPKGSVERMDSANLPESLRGLPLRAVGEQGQ